MALQAEQVDVTELEHVGIRPAVRQMARLASINLYGSVLVDEWPLLVGVALEANRILGGGSAHLFGACCAVHVVAIAALDQSFIHPVMERHIKLSFLLKVAAVAQLWLGLDEQEIRSFGMVRRMAGDATNAILLMFRVEGIHVLRAADMAVEAAGVDLLRGSGLKLENLRFVATAVDVGLAGSVASFATVPLGTLLGIQRSDEVGRVFIALEKTLGRHILMARLAGF